MPFTKQSYNYNLPMIGIGTGGMDYNTTYNAVLQALTGYLLHLLTFQTPIFI